MDIADDAQRRIEESVAAGADSVRRRLAGSGAEDCVTCGAAIPPARRKAMPSAVRCIDCQEQAERWP